MKCICGVTFEPEGDAPTPIEIDEAKERLRIECLKREVTNYRVKTVHAWDPQTKQVWWRLDAFTD